MSKPKQPTEKEAKDFGKYLIELSGMVSRLDGDVTFCDKHMHENEAVWRRLYVRTAFACIEAIAFFLKQHALNRKLLEVHDSFRKGGKLSLPLCDVALLLEETYNLDDKGEPKIERAKLRTAPNLLFALSSFAQCTGSKHVVTRDTGYGVLAQAARIRDGLTHPKDLGVLNVTDEQLTTVRNAFHWVIDECRRIILKTPGVTISEFRRSFVKPTTSEKK